MASWKSGTVDCTRRNAAGAAVSEGAPLQRLQCVELKPLTHLRVTQREQQLEAPFDVAQQGLVDALKRTGCNAFNSRSAGRSNSGVNK